MLSRNRFFQPMDRIGMDIQITLEGRQHGLKGHKHFSKGTPYPRVQQMPCTTNTSVRAIFFEHIVNQVLNYVPGFKIEVSG